MNAVCFYFQVHQPWRLRKDFNFFNIGIGHGHGYDDERANAEIVRKVARKCYLPAGRMMLDLIRRHRGAFRISYSITGTALDQFDLYCPEVVDLFKELVDTGCVELIGETYHHSLSYLFSKQEFHDQVAMHKERMLRTFGVAPKVFRNTELIYDNTLARQIEALGYDAILTEGADKILGWRSPNFVYMPRGSDTLRLLLKNYRLSDDLAFRFGDPNWAERPLSAKKYASWIHQVAGNGETVNLFMDYETFGEHQWESTGIFEMFDKLPGEVLGHSDFRFMTPSEVVREFRPVSKLDVPQTISWADTERDTTAWLGNPMQNAMAEMAYALEGPVKASGDDILLEQWRRLLTSDHFYYACTKFWNDGDVHKYFSPYASPYDAFIVYSNVLTDLRERLREMQLVGADA